MVYSQQNTNSSKATKYKPTSEQYLQAHWAGAKRQQHLPKELVLWCLISTSSIIHQIQKTDNMNRQIKTLKVPSANMRFASVGQMY